MAAAASQCWRGQRPRRMAQGRSPWSCLTRGANDTITRCFRRDSPKSSTARSSSKRRWGWRDDRATVSPRRRRRLYVLLAARGAGAGSELYKRPLYNAAADFEPVALIQIRAILIARKDFQPTRSPNSSLTHKESGELQYSSAGGGSGGHVCAIMLDTLIGTRIAHVPYRAPGRPCRT